jgi:hypothetical protein
MSRDWSRFAEALDMRLGGATLDQIAAHVGGVSRERARQMVIEAKQQLAYRVFKGVPSANAVKTERQQQALLKDWELNEVKHMQPKWGLNEHKPLGVNHDYLYIL